MAEIIYASDVVGKIRENIRAELKKYGVTPHLSIVRVGENAGDVAYERGVIKVCGAVGIEAQTKTFPNDISREELVSEFARINEDPETDGILMFKPLPPHIDGSVFDNMIDPEKDLDCMSGENRKKLLDGSTDGFFPCTAEAVMKVLEAAKKNISGANVVIIGRSQVIGRPLGLMMLAADATVTWCHSATKNIAERCAGADIIVSACGVPEIWGSEIVKDAAEGCVAIDVGINCVNGKMTGDFDFEKVAPYVAAITPVPGGVGSVTSTVLCEHAARAAIKKARRLG